MNALRGLLSVLALSVVGCAARPGAPASQAPNRTVAPIASVETTSIESVSDVSPTLAKLVVRAHGDPRRSMVFTKACKASRSVALLERAGLVAECTENALTKTAHDSLRPYDVVILEKAPDEDDARVAHETADQRIPVVAVWQGDAPMQRVKHGPPGWPIELAGGHAIDATHYAIWQGRLRDGDEPTTLRTDDLGLLPYLPASITVADDGSATVVGRLHRLPRGATMIETSDRDRPRTRVILHGAGAAGLTAATTDDDRFFAMASVRGRIHFDAATSGTYVWDLDVTSVDVHLDEAKMRALTAQHAKVYDRAVMHVAHDQLALAANDLEQAAKVFDDALRGKAWDEVRFVRFDRLMAARLREVAAEGASAEAILERVAQFQTIDAFERDLLVAAGKLARAKLLGQYRSARSTEEAEHVAHVYFFTVDVVHGPFPEPCSQMMERFASLRSGGHYRPPPFYREGEAQLPD